MQTLLLVVSMAYGCNVEYTHCYREDSSVYVCFVGEPWLFEQDVWKLNDEELTVINLGKCVEA